MSSNNSKFVFLNDTLQKQELLTPACYTLDLQCLNCTLRTTKIYNLCYLNNADALFIDLSGPSIDFCKNDTQLSINSSFVKMVNFGYDNFCYYIDSNQINNSNNTTCFTTKCSLNSASENIPMPFCFPTLQNILSWDWCYICFFNTLCLEPYAICISILNSNISITDYIEISRSNSSICVSNTGIKLIGGTSCIHLSNNGYDSNYDICAYVCIKVEDAYIYFDRDVFCWFNNGQNVLSYTCECILIGNWNISCFNSTTLNLVNPYIVYLIENMDLLNIDGCNCFDICVCGNINQYIVGEGSSPVQCQLRHIICVEATEGHYVTEICPGCCVTCTCYDYEPKAWYDYTFVNGFLVCVNYVSC